jgi:hypothetical protein
MPTFLTGLPLHVLVVHAVVVLVPLAALGGAVVAVWPRARRRWGWPVVVLTAVAVVSIPIATSTGEGLEHDLPRTAALETHTHLGDELLPFAAGLLVAVLGLMLVELLRLSRATTDARHAGPGSMRAPRLTPGTARVLVVVLAVVAVGFAAVTMVQVIRIGDSGARAAWGDVQYVPQAPGGERD